MIENDRIIKVNVGRFHLLFNIDLNNSVVFNHLNKCYKIIVIVFLYLYLIIYKDIAKLVNFAETNNSFKFY